MDEIYKTQRKQMVETQLRGRGISDERVLKVMEKVERHRFIPEMYRQEAYEDHPVPIGEGQTISQPYIVAYMTEALEVRQGHKVLEIGTGSGYQAAILAELGAKVYTIEIIPALCNRAKKTFKDLGYNQIKTKCGDGYQGWPSEAPFQRIILTAAPPEVPEELIRELAEGGILIAPVGTFFQELIKIEKKQGKLKKTTLLPVRFVPMVPAKT